jgi:hypothetical protein
LLHRIPHIFIAYNISGGFDVIVNFMSKLRLIPSKSIAPCLNVISMGFAPPKSGNPVHHVISMGFAPNFP